MFSNHTKSLDFLVKKRASCTFAISPFFRQKYPFSYWVWSKCSTFDDYGDQIMSMVAVSYVFITRLKKPNRHISVGQDDVYIHELNYIPTFSTITEDDRKISRISQV